MKIRSYSDRNRRPDLLWLSGEQSVFFDPLHEAVIDIGGQRFIDSTWRRAVQWRYTPD
jgi:hypothetical protein